MPGKPCCGPVILRGWALLYSARNLLPKSGRNFEPMTLVLKQIIPILAMMMLFVPFTYPQAKDAGSENETLRHAAEKTGFLVGTTIQGRMWNRDPEYKPVLSREFNAAVSIVFQGI